MLQARLFAYGGACEGAQVHLVGDGSLSMQMLSAIVSASITSSCPLMLRSIQLVCDIHTACFPSLHTDRL